MLFVRFWVRGRHQLSRGEDQCTLWIGPWDVRHWLRWAADIVAPAAIARLLRRTRERKDIFSPVRTYRNDQTYQDPTNRHWWLKLMKLNVRIRSTDPWTCFSHSFVSSWDTTKHGSKTENNLYTDSSMAVMALLLNEGSSFESLNGRHPQSVGLAQKGTDRLPTTAPGSWGGSRSKRCFKKHQGINALFQSFVVLYDSAMTFQPFFSFALLLSWLHCCVAPLGFFQPTDSWRPLA